MCKFFSCISNGKGKVLFFSLKDIEKIEKEGNQNNYNWNSHTSMADYYNIKCANEDKWNKWEYDNEKKELKIDALNTFNDSESIKPIIEKYINENNAIYLQKIYNRNSGNRNSGDRNSGDSNSGNRNSGDWNSGNSNSGDSNSGNRNSGDRNSGDSNSGDWNSGDWNSGNSNSGNWNSGNRNSGDCNSTEPKLRIFNKETSIIRSKITYPNYFYFDTNKWIEMSEMTNKEKKENVGYETTEGYLKKLDYRKSWIKSFKQTDKKDVSLTLQLPNFNYKIFEEISGISETMIQEKLETKTKGE